MVEIIEAVPYEDMLGSRKTFRKSHVNKIHIHLPSCIVSEPHILIHIFDDTTQEDCCADIENSLYDTLCSVWIDIGTKHLDMSIGLHIYRLVFLNQISGDQEQLYISYRVQDDNPDTPYIYNGKDSDK